VGSFFRGLCGPQSCVQLAERSRKRSCSPGSCRGRIICSPVSRLLAGVGSLPFNLQRSLQIARVLRRGRALGFIKQYLDVSVVLSCDFTELSQCHGIVSCAFNFLLKIMPKSVLVKAQKFTIKSTARN